METTRTHPGYAFTDPLGSVSDQAPRFTPKALTRIFAAGSYAVGAATVLTVLLLPDGDPSDHAALGVIGVVMLALSLLLTFWRDPPDLVLVATAPASTLMISALVAVTRPMAVTPMFYILPLVLVTYCFQRREVVLTYVFVVVGLAVALAGWALPESRVVVWASVAIVGGLLTAQLLALKERLELVVANLRSLATHDPLTGLLNRRAFATAMETAVERAARGEDGCAIAMLDVDHFKRINDTLGHAAGDRAIEHVAATISARARAADVVGRLGGEEFAVLLHATDARGAGRYAESLRAAVAAPAGDDGPSLTVSIGVAELGGPVQTPDALLAAADAALYTAKEGGRNRVMVADPSGGPAVPRTRPFTEP